MKLSIQESIPTIMMVDDESTTMDVIREFLRDAGYERFIALDDPLQALDVIERERPDVLLLDLMMPGMSGLEVLRIMRDRQALAHIPVVILTSSTGSETKLEALELGATDFLAKPVDPSELLLRLRNTLAAKAYQDRLTYSDALTGLPNRRRFTEQVGRALRRATREGTGGALVHIDIDRFRQINDTLGEGSGDALLQEVAQRIAKAVGEVSQQASEMPAAATLFRIGGDEFVAWLAGASVRTATLAARRILSSLTDPFSLGHQEIFVSASIGIVRVPNDGDDVATLLGRASVAMSHAKRDGGDALQFYSESLNARSMEQLSLENHLRRALERGELSLHYQPKVDVTTNRIVGAEALMRWTHPELGSVPPDRFIPIAESTGMIETIGAWALEVACTQLRAWSDSGTAPIRIAVNVSGKQLRSDGLVETIRNALERTGLEGSSIVLELTESVIMQNPAETSDILHTLKQMGLQIAVDDFGTGYSSLSHLKRFPIDELKIDRAFIRGVPHDADDAAIVTATIMMAHGLGLKVVAEGVEDEAQLAFLRERGCDLYQGYLRSRPVPSDEFPALLQAGAEGF